MQDIHQNKRIKRKLLDYLCKKVHIKIMQDLIARYKALAHDCRLRILFLLIRAESELCICELMDALRKEQYQISRCLSILKSAGLIRERREGRLLFYSPLFQDNQNKHIFAGIKSLKDDSKAKQDWQGLQQRLAKREEGKVVLTYCCNNNSYNIQNQNKECP